MITVTRPVEKPTNIQIQLEEGGSFEPNTTYYVVMVSYSNTSHLAPYVANIQAQPFHSDISDEVSFITTDTHKSITISWDVGNGGYWHQVLISKISGDYTKSKSYATHIERIGIGFGWFDNDNANGLYLDKESDTTGSVAQLVHSYQFPEDVRLPGNIDKKLGDILVEVNGFLTSNSLDHIYNAIVDAGFEDYVFFDGYNFLGRVSFIPQPGSVGILAIEKYNLCLFRGMVGNVDSPNFIIRFGSWISDEAGADPSRQSNLDVIGGRIPVSTNIKGGFRFYGGNFTLCNRVTHISNTDLYDVYYKSGQSTLSGYVDDIRECVTNVGVRALFYDTSLKDLKINALNNWSGGWHYRIVVTRLNSMHNWTPTPYYGDDLLIRGWVDTKFTMGNLLFSHRRMGTSLVDGPDNSYVVILLNPIFSHPDIEDNKLNTTHIVYSNNALDLDLNTFNNGKLDIYHSVGLNIIDEEKNPVEDAILTFLNKDNGDVDLYSVVGFDRDIGDLFEEPLKSDDDGIIPEFYFKSYRLEHRNGEANWGTVNNQNSRMIDGNPFTIIIEKEGYETTIINKEILEKTNLTLSLKKQVPLMVSPDGGVYIKANPKNIGKNRDILI